MKTNKQTKKRVAKPTSIDTIALEHVTGGGPCSSDPGSPLPPCTYGN